ncbi:DUF2304 domain-containing protein [bacterium]|nr:MAG: DUF2304 domain-containing protein [bacterium]
MGVLVYLFQVLAIIGAVIIFGVVIDFIRRGLLKEKYSVLWLASAIAIIIVAVKKSLLDYIAGLIGVAYPPTLLFAIAFIFIILIILHFSVVISILHEKNKTLSQELTLIKNALREAGLTDAEKKKNNGQ